MERLLDLLAQARKEAEALAAAEPNDDIKRQLEMVAGVIVTEVDRVGRLKSERIQLAAT